jgi:hypothetical protein
MLSSYWKETLKKSIGIILLIIKMLLALSGKIKIKSMIGAISSDIQMTLNL